MRRSDAVAFGDGWNVLCACFPPMLDDEPGRQVPMHGWSADRLVDVVVKLKEREQMFGCHLTGVFMGDCPFQFAIDFDHEMRERRG